jgi:hypothetical protein
MTDEQRSPAARARAETALVRLLREIGDEAPFRVVLGGLVPAVLARDTTGVIPGHPQDRFADKATDRGVAATAADGPRACPASW